MGELAQEDAIYLREQYRKYYEQAKEDISMNFTDMDFENADKRDDMEMEIQRINRLCDECIGELDRMEFQ